MRHFMNYEFIYEFMYMKNIVKSYLKSFVPRFQMATCHASPAPSCHLLTQKRTLPTNPRETEYFDF